MSLIGNKSAGAIFGTFTCRFHISTALSELNVPLQRNAKNCQFEKNSLPFFYFSVPGWKEIVEK